MDAGPIAGVTASTTVPGPTTARAARPMVAVISAVVFGLITISRTSRLRHPADRLPQVLVVPLGAGHQHLGHGRAALWRVHAADGTSAAFLSDDANRVGAWATRTSAASGSSTTTCPAPSSATS